jgi:hypothetical protein
MFTMKNFVSLDFNLISEDSTETYMFEMIEDLE